MKGTIIDDLRIKIRYLFIIEPRSLPEYGGGCGDVYLLIGSVSVIRVYNLTTMTLLWSYQGNPSALSSVICLHFFLSFFLSCL
jgi:hypothetical protein